MPLRPDRAAKDMAGGKNKVRAVENGTVAAAVKGGDGLTPLRTDGATVEPPVKVNNSSLAELKHALDDAAKAFFNRDDRFHQSHRHEDVRVGFGWLSCLIAGGVSLYGWKAGWAATKGWTYFAVATYAIISGLLWLYAKFIEKDLVYVGSRRVVSKRVITEKLSFSSKVRSFTPSYELRLSYVQSTNGGKSLVRKHSEADAPSFGRFFDSDGYLDGARWDAYLGALLLKAQGDDPM